MKKTFCLSLALMTAITILASTANAALKKTAPAKAQIKAPVSAVSATTISVKDCGAVGDGKTDSTKAFKEAIEKAKKTGASVAVPKGKYVISGILELKAQSLNGEMTGAWGADELSLPEILLPGKQGGFKLLAGGSIHGLQITHDWLGKEPEKRAPSIEMAGVGCRISDTKIFGAWNAIWGNPKTNPARSHISNVFIVNVHNVGVALSGTYDVSWINNVEVWSPGSKTFPKSGIGFLLGKNDMLLVSSCFVFSANIAYSFVNDYPGDEAKDGGTWGTFTNCNADFSAIAIQIDGKHSLSFAGGTLWTHWHGLVVKGDKADVRMSGIEFGSNGGPAVWIDGGKAVAIGGCQIRRNAQGFDAPALRITGGDNVAISGCVITSSAKAIEQKEGLANVVLAGNAVRENVKE